MSEVRERPKNEDVQDQPDPQIDRVVELPKDGRTRRRRFRGALLGGGTLLLLVVGFE
jgi:hypothetical protein